MATDIFKVLGSIAIDTTEFNNKINAALQNVNSLASALNNLNGSSVNVNVNTAGSTVSGSTTTTGGEISNSSDDGSGSGGGININPTIPVSTGKGWTVFKGIAANLGTEFARSLFNNGKQFIQDGWERNTNKEVHTADFQALGHLSESEAEELMAQLNEFTRRTPLSLEETMNVASSLLTQGIEVENLLDTLQWLGDVTGGDSTKMSRVAKGLTDTIGERKLNAQNARQMSEAGVPIYQLIAEYWNSQGKSAGVDEEGNTVQYTADLIKGNLNRGVIVPTDDVLAAFEYASTNENSVFYNRMEKMMDTVYGQEQMIGENLEQIGANITRPLFEFMRDIGYDKLLDLTDLGVDLTSGEKTVEESFDDFETYQSFLSDYNALGNVSEEQRQKEEEVLADMEEYARRTYERQQEEARMREEYEEIYPENDVVNGGGSGEKPMTIYNRDGEGWLVPGSSLGASNTLLQMLTAQTTQIKDQVAAGIRESMSGVTITANVSTAPVRLDTGTLVGELAPHIDLQLGFLGAQSSWG